VLTFEQIKELIELVCERNLQGVEIERAGFRVRIDGRTLATNSSSTVGATAATAEQVSPAPPAAGQSVPVEELAVAAEAPEEESVAMDGQHLLRSPIVGTFYTSPSPDADPYVKVGDRVKQGQVLCIVEAMKLMNEIESDEDGMIEKVFPKNAQPVEYGEPLFAVRPD